MSKQTLIQIRKKNGLSSIKTSSGTITPRLFSQDVKKETEDGQLQGNYTQPTFPNTRQAITPTRNNTTGEWYWGGTLADLTEVIDKAKLREHLGKDRGHDKWGEHIVPGDVERRISDPNDSFFNHPLLWKTVFLEGGKANLDIENNMVHRAIYFCSLANPKFANRLSDANNKYIAAGWQYEILESDIETKKKADEVDKEIRAIELLAGMKNDEERIRSISLVMNLPGYNDAMSMAAAFILLKDSAAQNLKQASRFGQGKTYQDRFIELAETSIEELRLIQKVFSGLKRGRIRKDGRGGYQMNGESLEGVRDERGLVNFFANPDNQDFYIDLIRYLDELKQRT